MFLLRVKFAVLFLMAGLLLPSVTHAEKADRDKPVNLEADRVTIDDKRKVQVFEGNVVLVKGTMVIHAARLVVVQDDAGYQKGVATGTPEKLPHFCQKREGLDELIEGEAVRIEHDAKVEKTEFFEKAWVKSGLNEVKGPHISYDAKTENYAVNGGSSSANSAANSANRPAVGSARRVYTVMQPKTVSAVSAAPTVAVKKEAFQPCR